MIDLKSLISLPTYKTKIPSTGKNINFRPFVVKEEKLLLIAQESKNQDQILTAVKTIIESCVKEKIDFNSLTYFDVEYIFIKIRMKSMGEAVDIIIKDPETKEKFETTMDLDKVKIVNLNKDKDKFNIKLSDDFGITMKYPNLETMSKLKTKDTKEIADSVVEVLSGCIEKVYNKEQVVHMKDRSKEEIQNFVNNLPKNMFEKITGFFDELPYVLYEDEFVTPTGKKIPVIVKDFNNFFQ